MTGVVREKRRGRLAWLSLSLLDDAGVRHGFTLRSGGASRGKFASLNFTSRQGDGPERVRENWRRLEEAAGLEHDGWALLSQVHGARVVPVHRGRSSCHHRQDCPGADAMVTTAPDVALGVLTADCLPVIISTHDGRAIGVAHAGWKGTLQGIAVAMLEKLVLAADVRPGGMVAGLGPAVGGCCYQVGEEIYEAFREKWGDGFTRRVFTGGDPWRLDLQKANLIQLRGAGLKAARTAAVPLCTSCRRDLFFSHRRDGGRTGRMLAFARR